MGVTVDPATGGLTVMLNVKGPVPLVGGGKLIVALVELLATKEGSVGHVHVGFVNTHKVQESEYEQPCASVTVAV
jgi:hypothetical protein